MVNQYKGMLGERRGASPLPANDHPGLDRPLISTLRLTLSLGRFDMATAMMTMSRFRDGSRRGYLERMQLMCGYLCKMKHGYLIYLKARVGEPACSNLPIATYVWARTVYGKVQKTAPRYVSNQLKRGIVMRSYVDANLHRETLTGRLVPAVLHLANQTPVGWYFQATCNRRSGRHWGSAGLATTL